MHPPAKAPITLSLHTGQVSVWRDARRFRVVVAGRRWGKTQLARTQLLAWALRTPNRRFWYVAPDRVMAKDILWQDLKAILDRSWLASEPMETELRVPLINGSEIRLMGADDEDKLRGRGLGGVVFDEFADMSPAAWTEAIRPALSDYEAPALFIGTPKSYNHFYDLFLLGQGADAEWASWQFRTVDNPFIRPKEVEAARRGMDPKSFRQEYEASFEAISGRAYYAFSRGRHVQPVALDPALPVAVSFDFNINPATAIIGQRLGPEVRVWREVWVSHAGGEATRAAATQAKRLLSDAGWRGQIRVYGDATGRAQKTTGPSDHAVLREVFAGAAWNIGTDNPHVRDRVAAVNGRCESMDGLHHCRIDPSCVHLIADLEQVTFKDNGELNQDSNKMLTHVSSAFGYWLAKEFPAQLSSAVAVIRAPR